MRILTAFAAAGLAFLAVTAACGSGGGSSFPDAGLDASTTDTGGPACTGGQTDCGGVCADLSADVRNCGSCGHACQGGDLCCAGVCVKSSGCDFAVTGLQPFKGNQSGGDYITLTGAGFSSDMAVYIGDGRAPVLVKSPTSALIQTPPGPVRSTNYDITLVSTKGTAVSREMFQYVSAGLDLPWQKKPMGEVRGEHPGVAVMQDGRVLIAGGTTDPDMPNMALKSAELYTRTTDMVTAAKGDMSVPRWRDAATTLLDGRVLVVGGAVCNGTDCQTADLFDPTTDTFTPSKSLMSESRQFAWAVLMVDGRVMITSGGSTTAEIYDPVADTFSAVPLKVKHQLGQRIVRLRDGRVMIMGGDGCSGTCGPAQTDAELYDPKTGQFTLAAPMNQGRSQFTAHVLPDGRVMVFGGSSSSAGGVNAPMSSIEAYDPKSNTWSVMSYKLTAGRTWHASALVRDGTVLVMGGYTQQGSCAPSDTVDQVDPVNGTVTAFGTLPDPNTEWNAVTLLDGSVLGVGGGACGGNALPDLDFLPGKPGPN